MLVYILLKKYHKITYEPTKTVQDKLKYNFTIQWQHIFDAEFRIDLPLLDQKSRCI
jgi:hypothetical protein